MSKFITIQISELGKVVTGKTPSSKFPDDFGLDVPFITPTDSFDQKHISSTLRSLSEGGVNKLKDKLLPPNSILVTCIGSAMGKVALNNRSSITNQQINSIIVGNEFDTDYLYYCLKNNYKLLRNAAEGSTALPLLNKSDFESLSLVVTKKKSAQKKIADVLSALDDKIELNNRINAELEAIAKTLYDYWFVQFDFPFDFAQGKPAANGKPYKTSGGKMAYNPTLKREIPEGWEDATLETIVVIHDSKRVPLSNQQRSKMKGQYPYYGATSIMDYVNDYIFDGEFVLLAEDGSVMDSNGFPVLQYIYGKTWVNNHAHVLEAKAGFSNPLLHLTLQNIPVINIMSGSIQKKINQENLRNTNIIIPPLSILVKFNPILKQIYAKKIVTQKQNQQLEQLRDWLLPMLMNGQVSVTTT